MSVDVTKLLNALNKTIQEAKLDLDVLPNEHIMTDKEIADQYDNFKLVNIEVKESTVNKDWWNFTLEVDFPNADNADFMDHIIDNGYYDRQADNWGFDNWYPEDVKEQLKQIVLKEIPEKETLDIEGLQRINDKYMKALKDGNKYVIVNTETQNVAYGKEFDTMEELDAFIKDIELN